MCKSLEGEPPLGTQWNQKLVLLSQISFLHAVGPQNSLLMSLQTTEETVFFSKSEKIPETFELHAYFLDQQQSVNELDSVLCTDPYVQDLIQMRGKGKRELAKKKKK